MPNPNAESQIGKPAATIVEAADVLRSSFWDEVLRKRPDDHKAEPQKGCDVKPNNMANKVLGNCVIIGDDLDTDKHDADTVTKRKDGTVVEKPRGDVIKGIPPSQKAGEAAEQQKGKEHAEQRDEKERQKDGAEEKEQHQPIERDKKDSGKDECEVEAGAPKEKEVPQKGKGHGGGAAGVISGSLKTILHDLATQLEPAEQ